jgi:hypothetical protein
MAIIPGKAGKPGEMADLVIEALTGHRLLMPHPEAARHSARRATDPGRWLQQLSESQRQLDQAIAALLHAGQAPRALKVALSDRVGPAR